MNKKILILGSIIIIFCFVIIVTFFYSPKKQSTNQLVLNQNANQANANINTNTNTTNTNQTKEEGMDTSDWKTYRSEESSITDKVRDKINLDNNYSLQILKNIDNNNYVLVSYKNDTDGPSDIYIFNTQNDEINHPNVLNEYYIFGYNGATFSANSEYIAVPNWRCCDLTNYNNKILIYNFNNKTAYYTDTLANNCTLDVSYPILDKGGIFNIQWIDDKILRFGCKDKDTNTINYFEYKVND